MHDPEQSWTRVPMRSQRPGGLWIRQSEVIFIHSGRVIGTKCSDKKLPKGSCMKRDCVANRSEALYYINLTHFWSSFRSFQSGYKHTQLRLSRLQLDSNSDCWSWGRACWPLDRPPIPRLKFSIFHLWIILLDHHGLDQIKTQWTMDLKSIFSTTMSNV